jgi:hypothetical protein
MREGIWKDRKGNVRIMDLHIYAVSTSRPVLTPWEQKREEHLLPVHHPEPTLAVKIHDPLCMCFTAVIRYRWLMCGGHPVIIEQVPIIHLISSGTDCSQGGSGNGTFRRKCTTA